MSTQIKRLGKKGRLWVNARRKLKVSFEKLGITRCEFRFKGCLINDQLSFAHSRKRRFLTEEALKNEVAIACFSCHRILDGVMSHEEMYEAVMKAITERELNLEISQIEDIESYEGYLWAIPKHSRTL